MKVTGKIRPLGSKIFVCDMDFGAQHTASGLFIPGDNGKSSGIHPRWGRVWAIGPDQKDVKVGDWVCVEHGRWTRTVEYENSDGSISELRMIDNNAILLVAEKKPNDVQRIVMGTFDLSV